MKYDLSIIIPHFNSPKSLKILIDSIGDHKDVQVIVIDDRSDKAIEEFNEVKSSFSEERYVFLRNEGKKGAGTCRNTGLNAAEGKWLLFADADDYFTDDWYDRVSRYFDSEFDTVFFRPDSIDPTTGKPTERHKTYAGFVDEYDPSDLRSVVRIKYYWCVPWSKMINASMVRKNQISFSEVLYSNDIMFSAKVGVNSGNIHVDKNTIYIVTDSKGTLTKNMSQEAFFIRTDEEFLRFQYLKQQLSREEKKYLDYREGARRLLIVHNNKYGIKAWFKCLFKVIKNGYPLYSKRQ